ncbi:MAG: gamma-glutamyltransferase [Spirochaetales bacterium]|nr:gamma-glutamyltransferase [Spirochaetales bacterium]
MKKSWSVIIVTLILMVVALPVFSQAVAEKARMWDEEQAAKRAYEEKMANSYASQMTKPVVNYPVGETTRQVVSGRNIVQAGSPAAASAGLKILMEGGTAFDAALAIAGVQSSTEFCTTNILGGDAAIITYNAQNGKVSVYNGMGWAPEDATIDLYFDMGGIPTYGPRAVQIPGAWAGWMLMLEENGTLPLEQIMEPVIRFADESYSETMALLFRYIAGTPNQEFLDIFQNEDGSWKSTGNIVRNTNFANTLRELVEASKKGSSIQEGYSLANEYFYRGPIAERIVEWSQANGGLFKLNDFNDFYAEKQEPWTTTYRGYEINVCPPNSQGPALLEAMNILENFDLSSYKHNSAEYVDLVVQAMNVALNDRNTFYGDMRFVDIPEYIFTKDYAKHVADSLVLGEAMAALPDGRELVEAFDKKGGDTTYMFVADQYGNVVSCTHSLCNAFGSINVAGDTGILLNNRMIYFLLDEDYTNCLEPHKRSMQTIAPIIGMKDGDVAFFCGTPGADTQVQCVLQVVLNYIDFNITNPQKAIETPRVITAHPAGLMNHNEFPKQIALQTGFDVETAFGLEEMGYKIAPSAQSYGFMGFGVKLDNGWYLGGADNTLNCYVVGY